MCQSLCIDNVVLLAIRVPPWLPVCVCTLPLCVCVCVCVCVHVPRGWARRLGEGLLCFWVCACARMAVHSARVFPLCVYVCVRARVRGRERERVCVYHLCV